MSLLAIGVSHRSAPLAMLERVALDADGAARLAATARAGQHVSEAVVLATCNRVEVYADVATFHGGLGDLGAALATVTGVDLQVLKDHLYVHYADRAVAHLFTVACGLDSMAVGESQVLGQLRQALRGAQSSGDAGRVLVHLVQQALRVGKRAHAETGIDRAGASLVSAALARADAALPAADRRRVLVVGAGSMSALAATTVHRAGAAAITVANRTPARAERLAGAVGGTALPLDRLADALAEADLVISCTGAVGHVVPLDVARAAAERHGGPQLYVDLALPRDVDPAVAQLPGVAVADLEVLGADLADADLGHDIEAVRELVAAEVGEYLTSLRVQAVAPTVVALRTRAAQVVAAELARLDARLPDVADGVHDELVQTVHRVVEKLLHAPTVRVKELASRSDGGSYAAALRELFDLDPQEVAAVTDVPTEVADPRSATSDASGAAVGVDPGALVERGQDLSGLSDVSRGRR